MNRVRYVQPVGWLLACVACVGLVAGLAMTLTTPPWWVNTQARSQPPARKTTPAAPKKPTPATTDANRATPQELRDALYVTETFLGAPTLVPRPFAEAEAAVAALQAKYPADVRLLRYGARLNEYLGNIPKAVQLMIRYANLQPEGADGLRRLAAFYHGRGLYADEVRTLQRLALLTPSAAERTAVADRIAELVQKRGLTNVDVAGLYRRLIEQRPQDVVFLKHYLERLVADGKLDDALRALDEWQPKYPEEARHFLKLRAEVYDKRGQRDAAGAVYDQAFDPCWPRAIVRDWYDLLRRYGRYRTYRRQLQERFRKGATDFATAARLFNVLAYEGNLTAAEQTLIELEKRREKTGWSRDELDRAAVMCMNIGQYDLGARFLYSLHVTGGNAPGSPEREATLAKLVTALLEAGEREAGTTLGAGDLSLYADIAQVDRGAGFLNGILSLILAGNNIPREYAQANRSAAAYFNRALAYRFFVALQTEYPRSARLPALHVELLKAFAAMNEFETVIRLGDEFLRAFPESPDYAAVAVQVAEAEARLGRRDAERRRLTALLDWLAAHKPAGTPLLPVSSRRWVFTPDMPTPDGATRQGRLRPAYQVYDPTDPDADDEEDAFQDYDYPTNYLGDRVEPKAAVTYASVLERVIASFAAETKTTADKATPTGPNPTLAFLYGEIKKHPREEGLYERLLRWLGQQSLVDEQLKAYRQAVQRFGDNTWRHRLARWFVRNDRRAAFAEYSRQLAATLDDEDLQAYLEAFFADVQLSDNDNDARLYLQLFRFAHDRFPTNLFFVRGMLNAYRATNRMAEWARLAGRYYFADPSLRSEYLAYLSENNRLAASYAAAKSQAGVAHRQFAADAALWLSRHEEAVEAYRELAAMYPGETYYAERLATLLRSLSSVQPTARDEAAQLWAKLAAVHPTENRFLTLAGEIRAESGDWDGAKTYWEQIVRRAPGDPEAYLELATLYWDYYRYDDAVRTLRALRERSGDDTLYAYQLGALYEERQQRDLALAEYMAALAVAGPERAKVIERLAVLSRRKGFPGRIEAAFRARLAKQSTPALILGYADFLKAAERQDAAFALLAREAAQRDDIPFLEAVRDEFRAAGRAGDERQVLERMVALARDERENIKYRLQLAAFFETRNQRDDALQTLDAIARDHPTNLGVVQEVERFYGRLGAIDKAVMLARQSRDIAVGDYRRTLTLQLAKRQREAGRTAEAEQTLREWYAANPTDTEAFTQLANLLGETGRNEDLAALYKQGLAALAAGANEFEFRKGYIQVLTSLGRHEEAIDQYIELINREPEDDARLRLALRYAEQYNLLERLTRYYVDLATKADRNYRWNVVLAEVYRFQGNIGGAAEQYAKAIVNEPQRGDFRERLAALYRQAGRYDDALAVLKRAAELDPQNPNWAAATAEVYLDQGKPEQAVAALRESFLKRKRLSAEVYFSAGETLLEAGFVAEAGGFYDEGFARVMASPATEAFDEGIVAGWLRTVIYRESAVAALSKLEMLETALAKAPQNGVLSNRRYELDYKVRRELFPKVLRDYATAAQLAQLDDAVTQRLTRAEVNSADFQRLTSLAANAGLYRACETSLIRAKDAAYAARRSADDQAYIGALRSLLAFYEARLDTPAALRLLAAEEARDRFPGTFDFTAARADFCRNVGDVVAERTALEQYYWRRTGALATDEDPLVGRFLQLLYRQGDRAALQKLAAAYSPYQLQLINFLVSVREQALAQTAIENAGQSGAWQKARLAQLELYFRNQSPEVEALYRQALGIRPIGEQANRKPDPAAEVVGEDWFRTARNYGIWLTLDDARAADALRFLTAETEAAPRSATAQTALSNFLRARKRYPEALEHARLARELAPEDPEALAAEGAALYEMGDRTAALGVWRRMLEGKRDALKPYLTFLSVLADYGLLNEALPPVETYLVRKLRERARPEAYESLVALLAALSRRDAASEAAMVALLTRVTAAVPEAFTLGLQLTLTEMLPVRARLPLYRLVSEQLAQQILNAYSRGEYDLYDEGIPEDLADGGTLADALSKVQQAWAEQLVASKAYTEAERELQAMAALRQTLFGRMREDAPPDTYIANPEAFMIEPEWLVMAQAAVELRTGRVAAAVERLRRFVAAPAPPSNNSESDSESDRDAKAPDASQRAQHAYHLLLNEGRTEEAVAFLETYYRLRILQDDSPATVLGQIEAQFMRRQTEAALGRLKQFVEREGTLQALSDAATLAAKYGAYEQALIWRRRLHQRTPGDAENRVEMARISARLGDLGAAAKQLYELALDRRLTLEARLFGLKQLADIVRRQGAADIPVSGAAGEDAETLTIIAALQDAAGRTTEAQKTFERAALMPYATVARLAYGRFLEQTNRPEQAMQMYMQAVREGQSSDRADVIRAALAANRVGTATALARNLQAAKGSGLSSLPSVVYQQPVVPLPAALYVSAQHEQRTARLTEQRQTLARLTAAALAQRDEELALRFAQALRDLADTRPTVEEAERLLAEVRRSLEGRPVLRTLFSLPPTSDLSFSDMLGELR
ncbi:MAG: tetratricopeptide repeat protein [Chloracidobacterium sp.]|nr:tetratricopeptide repeat protein [Chloracidobacterium sp.]MDW8218419.1 tetratricopeptide repeat protein [Acidobacteriota bacterium]